LLGRSGGVFVLSREPNALEVLDRRKPQERKRRLSLAAGSFGELVRASRIAQRDQAAVGFAAVDKDCVLCRITAGRERYRGRANYA